MTIKGRIKRAWREAVKAGDKKRAKAAKKAYRRAKKARKPADRTQRAFRWPASRGAFRWPDSGDGARLL